MSEDSDWNNVEAIRFMLRLAHFTDKPGLKAACYRDAGVHLRALRHVHDRATWADMVQRECPVSVRRAYELMAVASGTKPLAELRAETRARARKHYRKQTQ
jgi:hypothetical protein